MGSKEPEHISLISSDEEEEDRRLSDLPTTRHQAQGSTSLGKRKAVTPLPEPQLGVDSDDEVVEVSAPEPMLSRRFASSSTSYPDGSGGGEDDEDQTVGSWFARQDDEEAVYQGHTGDIALADFPHARENCVQFRFTENPLRKCANCYCFVCDIVASDRKSVV